MSTRTAETRVLIAEETLTLAPVIFAMAASTSRTSTLSAVKVTWRPVDVTTLREASLSGATNKGSDRETGAEGAAIAMRGGIHTGGNVRVRYKGTDTPPSTDQ